MAFRSADEQAGVTALRDRAARERLPAFGVLADQRAAALRAAVLHAAGVGHAGAGALRGATELGARATEVLADWIAASTSISAGIRSYRERFVADLRAHYAALPAVLAADPDYPDPAGIAQGRPGMFWWARVAGRCGVMTQDAWMPFEAPALQVLGRTRRAAYAADPHLLTRVRRFPSPDAGPGGAASPRRPAERRAVLDRPDALLRVFDLAGSPTTRVLLAGAHAVLGHVLRDAGALGHALRALPAHADVARRDLVVALGLVGVLPDVELALPGPNDAHDLEAYLLAAVLAGAGDALGVARRLVRRVRGAESVHVLQNALMRLDAGELLSVVG